MTPMRCTLTLALLLALPATAQTVEVQIENPLDVVRPGEVVEIDWAELARRLPGLAGGTVRVTDAASGSELPVQVFDEDGDGTPDELLVLVSLWPGEARHIALEAAALAEPVAPRVHVRHDAARDDVAWENDRVAFRTYGQGLWALEDLVSSGIDVLTKRTRDLVLDRWYASGDYHTDHGEGADFFSVGASLGGGGTAVWHGGALHRARNFASHRVLADGPLRAVVELTYEPWEAGGLTASEVKRITIDAGQHVFRSESTFEVEGADSLTVAAGFVRRDGVVASTKEGEWAWLSTWGPVGGSGHGDLGLGAVVPSDRLVDVRAAENHDLALLRVAPGEPVVQYVGAGWTASGDVAGAEDWWTHLNAVAQRLAHPLVVTVLPDSP